MSDTETNALLIENLADLEAAMDVMSNLDAEVMKSFGQLAEDWALAEGWLSSADFEADDFYVAPAHWQRGDAWRAWFALEFEASGGEDWFYTSGLTGQGRQSARFVLTQEIVKLPPWRKLVAQHGHRLLETGLLADKENIWLPFSVDGAKLAKALREEGRPDAALAPLEAVLNQLMAAVSAVDELLLIAEQQGAPA